VFDISVYRIDIDSEKGDNLRMRALCKVGKLSAGLEFPEQFCRRSLLVQKTGGIFVAKVPQRLLL
jgi:hypothetical protein